VPRFSFVLVVVMLVKRQIEVGVKWLRGLELEKYIRGSVLHRSPLESCWRVCRLFDLRLDLRFPLHRTDQREEPRHHQGESGCVVDV
jgi:hypothetical protein